MSNESFTEILKVVYHGVTNEDVIDEAMRFVTSTSSSSSTSTSTPGAPDTNEMRITKFVALIEMIYTKERKKAPYPIAIALIHILEQIRLGHLMNEKGGNYIEAGKTQEQIESLLLSEASSRKESLVSQHKRSMSSLAKAHNDQFMSYKEG